MSHERRFSDEEVARILDDAAADTSSGGEIVPTATGLTMADLKEVASQAGIPETAIERAARKLDAPAVVSNPAGRHLGQTIGVSRAIDLPRPLSDDEWHAVVADLRQTFDAPGHMDDDGPFRQWANGNLRAVLEPAGTGERLRLTTLKGNARAFQTAGVGSLGVTAVLGLAQYLGRPGDPWDLVILGIMGLSLFLGSRLTVPAWARTRADQFEGVIERTQSRMGSGGPDAEERTGGEGS